MTRHFRRLSLKTQLGALIALLLVTASVAAVIIGRALVVSQTLDEGRSIANMVEHIGKWASQYGGLHVRSSAKEAVDPGTFLERRSYGAPNGGSAASAGRRLAPVSELDPRESTEVYHWKNPALIQREVSDVAAASTAPAKFRITAKTVLNPNNAPNEFERAAIEYIEAQNHRGEAPEVARQEYSRVENGRLLYARSIIASSSCLRCHGAPERAPSFLKANPQFNGGGGFGYEAGRPSGIISVSVPLRTTTNALRSGMTPAGWLAVAAMALACAFVCVFVARSVVLPVDRLSALADGLAAVPPGADLPIPELDAGAQDVRSRNEVHRLARAVHRLGHRCLRRPLRVYRGPTRTK